MTDGAKRRARGEEEVEEERENNSLIVIQHLPVTRHFLVLKHSRVVEEALPEYVHGADYG